MICRRNFTKEQIIAGLKNGHTFNIDRLDAPEMQDIDEMKKQGLVTCQLVNIDEQSSVIKCRWVK